MSAGAPPDPMFDAFLADVVASVDDDLAEDAGCPDVAAAVAMAHQLDPTAVSAEQVAEVQAWAPVVTIGEGRRRRQTRDDPEFAEVLQDVRSQVEQDVMARLGAPAAAAELQPAAANDTSTSVRRIWSGVLAAAAVLLLVGGGVLTGVLATRDRAELAPHEAALQGERAHEELSSARDERAAPAPEAPRKAVAPPPDEQVEVIEDVDATVEQTPEAEPTPTRRTPRPRRNVEPTAAPEPAAPELTLEELDAAAHAAWKAGDRRKAEGVFRKIIARAGKGRLADLAYGDLFTLARQTKAPTREVELWKEYLGKFPGGRFADDARAGLCRRVADDTKRRACWEDYLASSPKGAHRGQAKRELAAGSAG